MSCHNAHPESVKRDWKVGDVRGMQEVTITQPIIGNIFAFNYLLAYFALVALVGLIFIALQRRQAAVIQGMNGELETANEFLATLSMKISRYLSPQIYKSIFSGQKDVTIQTERKKLTIFFSDIQDFTATTERLQPEEITPLLNEYFTEMSKIALSHGGTIDKFVGDAMLIFFGDPETRGDAEDARACLRMAIEMQDRIAGLNAKWRNAGIEQPFRVRMGINTGYCNVGNFGSDDRMDYTIIGAEANLAARLQAVAQAGHIVVSYETYALVRDTVVAQALPPITHEGHQPRGRALRDQRRARFNRPNRPGIQRASDRTGFLPQRQHDRREQCGPYPQSAGGRPQGARQERRRAGGELAHQRAAIDADGLSGDEIAVIGAQIDQRRKQIGGQLLALDGAGCDAGGAGFAGPFRIDLDLFAHGQARRDGVDADIMRAKLARERTGHRHHGAF